MTEKRIKIKVFYFIFLYKLLAFLLFPKKKLYKQKFINLVTQWGRDPITDNKLYILGIHLFTIQKISHISAFLVLSFPIFFILDKYNCFEISFLCIRIFKKKKVKNFYPENLSNSQFSQLEIRRKSKIEKKTFADLEYDVCELISKKIEKE